MMILNDPKSFVINVTGASTGRLYEGLFKAKPLLSHREKIRQDVLRRRILETEGGAVPGEDANNIANIFSKIWVHVTEAPSWWKDARDGIELLDEEPVIAVLNEVLRVQKEMQDSMQKQGEEAKVSLTKSPETVK